MEFLFYPRVSEFCVGQVLNQNQNKREKNNLFLWKLKCLKYRAPLAIYTKKSMKNSNHQKEFKTIGNIEVCHFVKNDSGVWQQLKSAQHLKNNTNHKWKQTRH
jgi:hypothetical protein